MNLQRPAAIIGFTIVVAALLLQTSLTIPLRLDKGDSLIGAVVFLLSFFTILSNLMVAAVFLSAITTWRWLAWWRTPWVRAMLVGVVLVVLLVVHFLLSGLVAQEFWTQLADKLLHYVDPVLYVVWWLLADKHGSLRWGELPKMLVYPAIYLVWAMGRGAIVGEYPYPFLDAGKLGYGPVALNCLGVLAVLVLFYVLAIGVDRWLGRRALRAV